MLSRDCAGLGIDLVHGGVWTGVGVRTGPIEADSDYNLLHQCYYSIYSGRLLASFVGSGMAVTDRLHLLRCGPVDLYALPLLPSLFAVILD